MSPEITTKFLELARLPSCNLQALSRNYSPNPADQRKQLNMAPFWGSPFGFTNRILGFANGNIDHHLSELVRIAWAFGHDRILPYPATVR